MGESGVLVAFDTIFDIFVFSEQLAGRDLCLKEERRLVSSDVSGYSSYPCNRTLCCSRYINVWNIYRTTKVLTESFH